MTMQILVEIDAARALDLMQHVDQAIDITSIIAWMEGPLRAWYENEVVQRFAYEGDFRSGQWAPLSEATRRIRQSEGYSKDDTNIRTEELFHYSISHKIEEAEEGITFVTPDGDMHGELTNKYLHAQMGATDNPVPWFGPTPPRPVVAFDENADTATVLVLLATHIGLEIAGGGGFSMSGAP